MEWYNAVSLVVGSRRLGTTASFTVALFGTRGDFIPGTFPFLAPGKWTLTNDTNFGGEIFFFHGFMTTFGPLHIWIPSVIAIAVITTFWCALSPI